MIEEYTKLNLRHPLRKSIDKINDLVGAPKDGWSQDPDVELADTKYISQLIDLINIDLDDDDRFYLMEFLIACIDESLREGKNSDQEWEATKKEINNNIELYASILAYWSCYESSDNPDDTEQMFHITPKIREIWDQHKERYL